MTAIPKSSEIISPEEYLEGEKLAETRHEYVDGHVYAMAGASIEHNLISGNIYAGLRQRLRGKRCDAFINDIKVRIPPPSESYYYPDVFVACDPAETAEYYRERPTVIFEVLSPETARTDRKEKYLAYWQIPSLKNYVLVEQDRLLITEFRRNPEGWKAREITGPKAVLKLTSIGVELPISSIYERTAAWKVKV